MVTCVMDKLNKSYGQKHALIDFSCTLTPGIYGLLGPNGVGKSTRSFLYYMAGLKKIKSPKRKLKNCFAL